MDNSNEQIGLFSSLYFNCEQYKLFDKLNDFDLMDKYLQNAIDMDNKESLFYYGNYCEEKQDFNNMILYYEKAVEKFDLNAIYNLGNYYKNQKNFVEMIKLFKKGCILKDPDCMCELAIYYESSYNEQISLSNENKCYYYKFNVKKYYLQGIKLKYLKAYYLYGLWLKKIGKSKDMIEIFIKAIEIYKLNIFYKSELFLNCKNERNKINKIMLIISEKTADYFDSNTSDIENSIKYYEIAVELDSVPAMYNLGRIYYEINSFEKMKTNLLMAIEKKDIDSMFELSIYYQDINDFENMKKYYLMGLNEIENSNISKNLLNDGEKDFNLFFALI